MLKIIHGQVLQVDVIYMLFLPVELFSITTCLFTVYILVLYLINNFILKIIVAMTGPTGKKMEGFGNSPLQPASRYLLTDFDVGVL